jgi:predicted Ser/Thr protein kinase
MVNKEVKLIPMTEKNTSLYKLRTYCSTIPEFKHASISLIKQGHNRDVYLLRVRNKKYVARVGLHANDGGSSIQSEVRTLKFLCGEKIPFVSEMLHYDRKHNISIETFVGKHQVPMKDFNSTQIDCFARQLATIHQLSIKPLRIFCKKEGFPLAKIVSEKESIRIFGIRRFAKAMKTCPNKKVLAWIAPRLKINVAAVSHKQQKRGPHLMWGDIGDNVLTDKNNLFFIDWEFTAIGHSHELAYIKIHSHPGTSSFRYLVRLYAQYSKIPEELLYKEIAKEEKITRLNDVIWAAMKWGESVGTPKESFYREKTLARIKLFEQIKS